MRISCLQPDLFPVCEETLETLFHMLRKKNNFSFLLYPVITDFQQKVQGAIHGVTFNGEMITGQTNL